jgi:hypothetical protein
LSAFRHLACYLPVPLANRPFHLIHAHLSLSIKFR